MVHIEVQSIAGDMLALELAPEAKVEDLKAAVDENWEVPTSCQQLLLGAELLEKDEEELPSNEDVLSVMLFVSLDVVQTLLKGNVRQREDALTLLGKLGTRGGEDAIEAIRDRLRDRQLSVRTAALSAMTRVACKGDETAIAAVAALMEDSDIDVRHAAVSALAKVAAAKGDESAIAQIQLRLGHPHTDVQHTAIMALAKIARQGDISSIDALINKLECEDLHVRMRAHRAIAQIVPRGHEYTIGAISSKFTGQQAPEARIALISALCSVAQHGDGNVIATLQMICTQNEPTAVRERAQRAVEELSRI